jgi:hypothetical protein
LVFSSLIYTHTLLVEEGESHLPFKYIMIFSLKWLAKKSLSILGLL